ncbi:MAG: AMP-binding protein, partial [Nocardioidaceae bacterium]
MKYPLTLHHLLWRMEHVNAEAEIVTARGVGDDLGLERQTFAESVTRIRRLMAGLARIGVGPRDTVATLAWNSVEHFEVLLAVPALGATVNNLNLRLQAESLQTLAGDPRPSLLIVDADLLGDSALAKTASCTIRTIAANGTPVAVIGDLGEDADTDFIGYEDLLAADAAPLPGAVAEDDVAFLFHSGGTTGSPKTYEVTHRT